MISAQSAMRCVSGRFSGRLASTAPARKPAPTAIAINPAIARIASGVQKKNPCSGDNSTCNPCGAYQYIFRVTCCAGPGYPFSPL